MGLHKTVELTAAAGDGALRHRCHLPVIERLRAGVAIASAHAAAVDFLRGAYFQIAANALKDRERERENE